MEIAGGIAVRLVLCLAALLMLLTHPQQCAYAAAGALRIWGMDVVPSLYPYMVLCRLSASLLLKTRLPPAVVVSALGLLGGSPSGAAALSVYDDADRIPSRLYRPLAVLCGGVSPMFLLQTVHCWGFDHSFCLRLLLVHAAGAFVTATLTLLHAPYSKQMGDQTHIRCVQQDAVTQSIHGILSIGACIMLFSVCAESVSIILPWMADGLRGGLLHAGLEMAGGIRKMAALMLPHSRAGVAISFSAGFSGISIIMQNYLLLDHRQTPLCWLITFALLRALLCAFFACMVF